MIYPQLRNLFLISMIFAIFTYNTGCAEKEPVKIGFSANLTGRSSELGVSGRNGIEIAVDEINEKGGIKGRKIELIVKDDESDPEKALTADKELAGKGVTAIIGHLTSGANTLSLAYANTNNILMISPTISTNALTGIDDNFIRVIGSNKLQAEILADAAIKNKRYKISVLYDLSNRAYTEELYVYFYKKYEELGGKIVLAKTFSSGINVSFANIAKELLEAGPDAILSITSGVDGALLCQQLQKQSSSIPVYTGMWAMTDDHIQHGGTGIENNVFFAGVFDKYNSKTEYLDFKDKYFSRFKTTPTFSSMYSYEAAQVLFKAMGQSKDLSSKSLKAEILSIKQFTGLQTDFSIDVFGDSDRPYSIFTVKNKEFVRAN